MKPAESAERTMNRNTRALAAVCGVAGAAMMIAAAWAMWDPGGDGPPLAGLIAAVPGMVLVMIAAHVHGTARRGG